MFRGSKTFQDASSPEGKGFGLRLRASRSDRLILQLQDRKKKKIFAVRGKEAATPTGEEANINTKG